MNVFLSKISDKCYFCVKITINFCIKIFILIVHAISVLYIKKMCDLNIYHLPNNTLFLSST